MKVYELFDPEVPYAEFYRTKREVLVALKKYRAARNRFSHGEGQAAGYIVLDDVPSNVVDALNYAYKRSAYNDDELSGYYGPASMGYYPFDKSTTNT